MGELSEGKRRAPIKGAGESLAAPAQVAQMWRTVSEAHEVLRQRRLYWLSTEAEERFADELTLIPLLADWVPVSPEEVAELSAALRRYIGTEIDSIRDREAAALTTCVRAMTLSRARSAVPFPGQGDEGVAEVQIV